MKIMSEQNQSKLAENTPKKQRGRPFPKGISGNPKGKPKGTFSLISILKRELQKIPPELKGKERKMYAEILIKKQLHKAIIEGDEQSIKLIWNYVEGMPRQPIDLEIPEIAEELRQTREMLNNIFNE